MKEVRDVLSHFFPTATDFKLVRVEHGASGPRVVVFTRDNDSSPLALKYGRSRVPIKVQLENRCAIAPFFEEHLVSVLASRVDCEEDEAAILMPAFDSDFHEAISSGQLTNGQAKRTWADILAAVSSLWATTQQQWVHPNGSLKRNPLDRINTVANRLQQFHLPGIAAPLGDVWHNPVVVNGRYYPSLAETFEALASAYQPPRCLVLCHGDLNANNIMVNRAQNWALADWEWCGYHDWRLSCSHLIGWWLSNGLSFKRQPSAFLDQENRVHLDYQAAFKSLAVDLSLEACRCGQSFGQLTGELGYDEQMQCMLSVMLFGDIRFLDQRRLDSRHAIYLIGEAIRLKNGGKSFISS